MSYIGKNRQIALFDTYERDQIDGFLDTKYDPNSILGTVSQSAGFPTGAIIERGSNANGEYVKYADGTAMCWGTRLFSLGTTVSGGAYFLPFGSSSYDFSKNLPVSLPSAEVSIHSIVGYGNSDGTGTLTYVWFAVEGNGLIYYTNRARNSGTTPSATVYRMESEGVIGAISISSTRVSWSAIGRWN